MSWFKGKQKAGLRCGYAHPWVSAKALHAVRVKQGHEDAQESQV